MDCPNNAYLQSLSLLSDASLNQVKRYLTVLETRNYAVGTLSEFVSVIKRLLLCLPELNRQRAKRNFTHVTSADLDAFIQAARRKGLAPSTINHSISMLKNFFEFLRDEGEMPTQPVLRHRHSLIAPTTLPKPIPEADLTSFFKVIDSVRDRLLFLLMLRCGLRVSEACALNWQNVDLAAGTLLIVNGKGQVDRTAFIAPDVAQAFKLWPPGPSPKGPVFPGQNNQALSRHAARGLMSRYLRQAGIAKPYSPHCLRHTFATQLLNEGVGLEVLKELMGHRSLQMTLRYTQLYDATKRRQYEQAMERITQRQATLGR